MRTLISLVVAAAILAGAYAVTFGVPAQVSAMLEPYLGDEAAAQDSASEASTEPERGQRPGAPGGGGRGANAATTVVTTALTLEPYESVLSAVGTASALRSVAVMSNVAGTVIEANLQANRVVEPGEVLVRLDARMQTLNLEIAQANFDQAHETVERYERLRAAGNSTVTDVTLSEAQLDQRLAEAAVGLAQLALEDRTIRAPIAGRLSLSDVEIGDVLTANSTIANIDQSDALMVEFELPERAIGLLAEAKVISAITSTFIGEIFEGEIISYDSRIDSITRSVTVEAEIANTDGRLWPGMTFAVRLAQLSEPLPALPSTAITWSREGSGVWIDLEGVAERVPVTILFRRDDTVWIDADIAEGTMVVTEGAQKLRDGARIVTPDGARNRGERPGTREPRPDETSETTPGASADRPLRPTPEEPT